jgi:hypothetical protein
MPELNEKINDGHATCAIRITSFNESLDHDRVAIGFFEFSRHDPDLSIRRYVFASFVENTSGILIGF